MKILNYTDIHFREYSPIPYMSKLDDSETSHGGLTRELENIILGCKFVADCILKEKPDLVINTGDTFHDMRSIPTRVLYGAHIGLGYISRACKEIGAKHKAILGNHDIISTFSGNNVNSVSILSGYYDEIITSIKKEGEILYIPYQKDAIKFIGPIRDFKNIKVCYTHMECQGVYLESGKQVSSPIRKDCEFPIISGHIHTAQEVGSWHFTGSLIRNKFVDADTSSIGGVSIYHDGTLRRIRNTRSFHYLKKTVHNTEDLRDLCNDLCSSGFKYVLRVEGYIPREEAVDILQEIKMPFQYLSKRETFKVKESVENKTVNKDISQESLINTYVHENRPEALSSLIKIFKEI